MMGDYRPPLTVQHIAADLCREILADHADWPLALQLPEHTWPRVFERTPACPVIPFSHPAGPCVAVSPGDTAVYVHLFVDGAWVDPEPDWRLPYPEGFEAFRSYPEGTRLPLGFRVDLVQRVQRRVALTAADKQRI